MSDRLAVMSRGRIEQVGTPEELYERPTTEFVADFLGVSNLMSGAVEGASANGSCRVRLGHFAITAGAGDTDAMGPVKVVIRPERVRLEPYRDASDGDAVDSSNRIPAMIERAVYLGSVTHLILRLAPGETLQAMVPNEDGARVYEQGTPVRAYLPAEAVRVLRSERAPDADADEDEEAER